MGMEGVVGVVFLVVAQYLYFSARVGQARVKYAVSAPAVTGHEMFERHFRVQQNTLEQLVAFIPVAAGFTLVAQARGWPGHELAMAAGVVWMLGRLIYARSYIRDPASRSAGFLLTFMPTALMLLAGLYCVVF